MFNKTGGLARTENQPEIWRVECLCASRSEINPERKKEKRK